MIFLEDKHNNKQLQVEVNRLSGLRQFPTTTAAKTELKKALATAQTLHHASSAIDRLMETAMFCPTPAEIRQAVESTPATERRSPDCQICSGSGWYHIEMENNIHGSMVCCTCSVGDMKRGAIVGVHA